MSTVYLHRWATEGWRSILKSGECVCGCSIQKSAVDMLAEGRALIIGPVCSVIRKILYILCTSMDRYFIYYTAYCMELLSHLQ